MRALIIFIVLFPLSNASYAQDSRFELYGGLNLTQPIFLENFASSEVQLGYTLGGLFKFREKEESRIYYQIGLGFSERNYNVLLDFSIPNEPSRNIFAKNLIHDIEIPILGVYVWHFNDFRVQLKAGIIPGFNILYKSEINFTNITNEEGIRTSYEETRSVNPNAFKRMNLFTGISLVKKFDSFNMGLQPNFQYNFMPLIQEDNQGAQFWTYGLNLIFSK